MNFALRVVGEDEKSAPPQRKIYLAYRATPQPANLPVTPPTGATSRSPLQLPPSLTGRPFLNTTSRRSGSDRTGGKIAVGWPAASSGAGWEIFLLPP